MRSALILFCLFLVSAHSSAQTDSLRIPNLNNHIFTRNALLDGPFTNTLFQFRMGVGQSSKYLSPTLNVNEFEIAERSNQLLFAGLFIDYQQNIKDGLAIYFKGGFSGRVGNEAESILTQGLNTVTRTTVGWRVRLLRRKKHRFSVSFDVRSYSIRFTNVLRYLGDLIGGEPNPSVTEKENILQPNIGSHYAYALNDLLGINMSLFYTFGDDIRLEKQLNDFNFTIGADINLKNRFNIPMGVGLGISRVTIPEFIIARKNSSTTYNTVISYIGKNDLTISLDISLFENPIESTSSVAGSDLTTRVQAFSLNMVYFF